MHHLRKLISPSATSPQRPPSAPPLSAVDHKKKGSATSHPQVESKRVLGASPSAVALSTPSPSSDPTDLVPDKPGSTKESAWRAAYGAARIALDTAKDSSDMFPPLKAVLAAISVLVKNYDQMAANVGQMEEIGGRVRSVGEILVFPVGERDSEEKARRESLRKKLAGIVAKLEPLSEQHGILKFLKNADHAGTLSGFVQDLAYAVTDYQTSLQQSIHRTTKKIDSDTNRIDENIKNMMKSADLELLGKLNPVHHAGYQAGHHDTCLPGTRKPVLQSIMEWVEDPEEKHVFWLNGLAGTGKSTITQTFSGMVAETGSLGASFFCSRDYADRKELKNIFPTLAYQLACRYPEFRNNIIQTIKQDPSVASRSLVSQLKDLIVDPLSSAGVSCVIVVDALDECVDDKPSSALLSVLNCHIEQLSSIKFFITGRPEPRIRAGFRPSLLGSSTKMYLLHEVEPSSIDEDIRLYLQEKLTSVSKRSDVNLPDPWPCDEDLKILTEKSSGFFIFASTLVKFIESEHHEPVERLRLLLTQSDKTVHEGQAGIDRLYTDVLVHAFSGVKDTGVFAKLRRILGAIVLASNPLSRRQIADILGINSSLIATTLRHLHSVLLVPNEDSGPIRIFHKSFPDFLQDPDRCADPNFFIDPSTHHGDMALGCLELLKTLKPNPCDLPDFVMNQDVANLEDLLEDRVGSALRYACGYWATHIRSSPAKDDHAASRLIGSMMEFLESNAVPWIEVMSLENRLETAIHGIHDLLHWLGMVNVPTSSLRSVAQDCLRFMMHFFSLIQQSATHIYHSVLPLSPERSMFRSMIIRERTQITEFYGRSDAWGALARTIKPTSGSFTCMTTFGNWIVAAGSDDTVRIYDSVTGALRLLLSPGKPVDAMEGSPRGDLLYCAHSYPDSSISLWDIQTGALIYTFVLDQKPKAIAISPEGRYFACAIAKYNHGVLKVWEVGTDAECTLSNAPNKIRHLCWLQPEGWLAAAEEGSVGIWDLFAGRLHCSSYPGRGVCGWLAVRQLAYSQEVDRLAVLHGNYNELETAVTIVDPRTGGSTAILSIRRSLDCIAFSRTTGELICGTKSHGLQLLDISTQCWKGLEELHDEMVHISSLPNGVVAVNAKGSGIQLWNLDGEYTSSRQPTTPEFTVAAFDKGTIVGTVSIGSGRITLLEPTTMSQFCTIAAQVQASKHPIILCASLEQRTVVSAVAFEGHWSHESFLELWAFGSESPRWTARLPGEPKICGVSPSGNRLVVFGESNSSELKEIHVLNIQNGRVQATFITSQDENPLEIEFESDDRFYSLHNDHRIPYVVSSEPGSRGFSHSLIRQEALPLVEWSRRCYDMDDTREWVVCGSKRICWIPPGYVREYIRGQLYAGIRARLTYCWAGNSLFMVGRDWVLRKFAFSGQS